MSKKVLIDKQALIDKLMKIPGIGSNSDALKTIKRFPSYEPQKVKVPAFVAKWIELCKEKADAASCLNGYYEIGNGTIVRPRGFSEEFYDWLADCDHMDALARAWLDGYEVEEETKYYVNIGYLYLKEPLGDTSDFTIGMTWNREYAYPFDSWNMAREHASKLGGTVEKV